MYELPVRRAPRVLSKSFLCRTSIESNGQCTGICSRECPHFLCDYCEHTDCSRRNTPTNFFNWHKARLFPKCTEGKYIQLNRCGCGSSSSGMTYYLRQCLICESCANHPPHSGELHSVVDLTLHARHGRLIEISRIPSIKPLILDNFPTINPVVPQGFRYELELALSLGEEPVKQLYGRNAVFVDSPRRARILGNMSPYEEVLPENVRYYPLLRCWVIFS